MIISRTPFRISFFGGGTDYPEWYRENGGAVLATTIDKYCYLNCRYLPPFFEHRSRIVWSQIELVRETGEIQHPAVREVLSFIGEESGVEIHHDGDLPARAGLGSSSSFVVGLLNSLYALQGVHPSKEQLARDAILVERERIKETVGSQDQVSAAFGGFNRIDFDGQREFCLTPIELPTSRLEELQDNLMLVFTGQVRTASEIAGEQVKAIRSRATELTAMHQSVDEAVNILSNGSDLAEFGRLLDESWKTKRSLTPRISTREIDDIYAAARKAGVLGGKLLGAGGGGFMLFFVRPEQRRQVEKTLDSLLRVPFRFESSGSHIIFDNEHEAAH
jgi:D-glycero-alpha-D-manno-heptose-7-phosphate kinase